MPVLLLLNPLTVCSLSGSSVCGIGAALFVTNAVEMHIIAAFLALGLRLAL
jgi:hypothetical protein